MRIGDEVGTGVDLGAVEDLGFLLTPTTLALVCGDPACAPGLGALALTVPRARCEVCGGSDIQRAAHGFIRACQAAGITRVRFTTAHFWQMVVEDLVLAR